MAGMTFLAVLTGCMVDQAGGYRGHAQVVAQPRPAFAAYLSACKDLFARNVKDAETNVAASRTIMERTPWVVMIVGGSCTLICISGAIWLIKNLSRSLQKIAAQLSTSSAHVTAAGAEVSATSQSLATGASEQAARLPSSYA